MPNADKVNGKKLEEKNEVLIDDFLVKKRKEIIFALAQKRRMSHGELAQAVGTSIASLSNILVKFERFNDEYKIKLVDSESEGKYRYYFLTEMCRRYLDNRNQIEYEQQNIKVVQYETAQLLQKVKTSLAQYKEWCEDDYTVELSEGLIERMYCKNIVRNEKERVIDDIIINCEKLLLHDYETYSLEIINLLEDKHLQNWFTKILDKFEGFRLVLMDWNREENIMQIYNMLESAVESAYKAFGKKEKNGWQEGTLEEGHELFSTVFYIIKSIEFQKAEDINDCFMCFMAGNKYLSGFMTHLIMKYYKKREECI